MWFPLAVTLLLYALHFYFGGFCDDALHEFRIDVDIDIEGKCSKAEGNRESGGSRVVDG